MSWQRLQAAGSHLGATTATAAFPGAATPGSLLVAWILSHGAVSSISDNSSSPANSWHIGPSFANISGSSKIVTWCWCLTNTSASTLTITANLAASGDQWMQAAEYLPPLNGYPMGERSTSDTNSAASTVSSVSETLGTPVNAGDLVLMGTGGNVTFGFAFTAGSGMDNIVLDNAGKTGGEANTGNVATMCFGEALNAAANPSATISMNTTNNWSTTAIAFSVGMPERLLINQAVRRAAFL